jgi:TrmH family RNA methyltransferase
MLSKNQIKLIKSLALKKNRSRYQLFTVEGVKGISEFLNSPYICRSVYTTNPVQFKDLSVNEVTDADLKRITQLKTPNDCLALFEIPEKSPPQLEGLILILDDIKDPGNLGTIIRLADWFGLSTIVCSKETVDCYNPKVVQASMGSLARVNMHYTDLRSFLNSYQGEVYGTYLDGRSIYKQSYPSDIALVMGNEAHGISKDLNEQITNRITIPQYGKGSSTESLNVATATAICLSEIKRTSGMPG